MITVKTAKDSGIKLDELAFGQFFWIVIDEARRLGIVINSIQDGSRDAIIFDGCRRGSLYSFDEGSIVYPVDDVDIFVL